MIKSNNLLCLSQINRSQSDNQQLVYHKQLSHSIFNQAFIIQYLLYSLQISCGLFQFQKNMSCNYSQLPEIMKIKQLPNLQYKIQYQSESNLFFREQFFQLCGLQSFSHSNLYLIPESANLLNMDHISLSKIIRSILKFNSRKQGSNNFYQQLHRILKIQVLFKQIDSYIPFVNLSLYWRLFVEIQELTQIADTLNTKRFRMPSYSCVIFVHIYLEHFFIFISEQCQMIPDRCKLITLSFGKHKQYFKEQYSLYLCYIYGVTFQQSAVQGYKLYFVVLTVLLPLTPFVTVTNSIKTLKQSNPYPYEFKVLVIKIPSIKLLTDEGDVFKIAGSLSLYLQQDLKVILQPRDLVSILMMNNKMIIEIKIRVKTPPILVLQDDCRLIFKN